MKKRCWPYLGIAAIAACIIPACSKEKAVAIQAMSNDLVGSVAQIEQRLDVYWGVFQPQTDALDKSAQIRDLALYLRNQRSKIVDGTLAADNVLQTIRRTPQAMDEIDGIRDAAPYAASITEIKRRAAAVKDAVTQLDKGSYFAADAVGRLRPILAGMADNLIKLNSAVVRNDAIVQRVNAEALVDFDEPSRRILAAVRDGNPSERDLITVITTELDRGFADRQKRMSAKDELSGRILATADIALKLVDAVENYKRVDWSTVTGMMSDLSNLAGAAELPDRYLVDLQGAQKKIEDNLKLIQPVVNPLAAPLKAETE